MDKKRSFFSGGMGVGYVTLMMIFAVICLTVLAVMAYRAASANDVLNEKSIAYTQEYYEADGRAKEKLMLLDKAAYNAHESAFFDSSFEDACACIEGVTLKKTMEGYTAEYSEPINERLCIMVSIMFYSSPRGGVRYRIISYKTVAADESGEEPALGVWDGSTIF